jgi:hypothetical protein
MLLDPHHPATHIPQHAEVVLASQASQSAAPLPLTVDEVQSLVDSLPAADKMKFDDLDEDGIRPNCQVQRARLYIKVVKQLARSGIPGHLSKLLRSQIDGLVKTLDSLFQQPGLEDLWLEECGLFRGGGVITDDPHLRSSIASLVARNAKFNCLSDLLVLGPHIQGVFNFAADITSTQEDRSTLWTALDLLVKF